MHACLVSVGAWGASRPLAASATTVLMENRAVASSGRAPQLVACLLACQRAAHPTRRLPPSACLCREQIEALLAKIEANWCAGRPYVTVEQVSAASASRLVPAGSAILPREARGAVRALAARLALPRSQSLPPPAARPPGHRRGQEVLQAVQRPQARRLRRAALQQQAMLAMLRCCQAKPDVCSSNAASACLLGHG